jgi:high affinity sulfate transporter 1
MKITLPSIKDLIPVTQWLPGYSLKLFGNDAISGITLAAYAIPVSMAYATLAGLPPQYGIYGYLIGGIFYALLGSARQVAVGPTSAISLVIGMTLANMAGGDIQRWLDLASLTAVMLAVISLLAYLLQLSSIINFISETVLLGFKAGAAIAIALTQLPKMFGVPGGGTNSYERFITLIHQLPDTNIKVLIFGIAAMILILVGERLLPGKPVKIVVVAIAIIVISFTSLGASGFKIVGVIPAGLPKLHFPSLNLDDIRMVLPMAFACFLLAYIETVSTAKAMGQKYNYEVNARQELLALGAANVATAIGNGYPVSGGLSQSAVNEKAGAKTPVSLIVASVTIGMCLLFLTGLLKNLPTVMLASIVLVAIRGLVDFKEFRRLLKVNHFDFIVACLALLAVIAFGILQGVVIAALASLILLIRIVSHPHIALLGKIPGTERYTDVKRHPDNEILPHTLIFRAESPLLYFNAAHVHHMIWPKITAKLPHLKVVIFDLSTSAYIDSTGARLIKKLYLDLHDRKVTFKIADAHSEVRHMLRHEDIEHLLGHVSRRDSLHDVIINTVKEHDLKHGIASNKMKKKEMKQAEKDMKKKEQKTKKVKKK